MTAVVTPARRERAIRVLAVVIAVVSTAGCMVGPTYRRPAAPVAEAWRGGDDPRVSAGAVDPRAWWRVFDDPALDRLVDRAYAQNLTLEAAGLRVVAAQAQRAVAVGNLFPQRQALTGSYTRTRQSAETGVPLTRRDFSSWQAGFDVAWEVDLWGRFRRAVQAADAELLAAVADYDDVLVSLVAQVATTYVQIRVIEERLALARANVGVQSESLRIARVRFDAGGATELDVRQAETLLRDTEARIPQLETELRRAEDALAVLLGMPPTDLGPLLTPARGIPAAPPSVAVGIPADLLRRRPDVRAAERRLAAQSARIGVAKADLFPSLQLAGSVGLSADRAARLAQGRALEAFGGPQLDWPVLNYGRLINTVRVEDATFQELVARYGDTMLQAQREVEDAIVGYARGVEEVRLFGDGAVAADRAVELALIQYREGAADFTRVLTAQQAKLQEDDALAAARGEVALDVVALYRALGGGWELREGEDFVTEASKSQMRARTWWGGMLDGGSRATDAARAVPAAADGR